MREATSFLNEARNLAAAFVEATTEYDYDELPEDVQTQLVEAATGVIKFMNPDTITIEELDDRRALGRLFREAVDWE